MNMDAFVRSSVVSPPAIAGDASPSSSRGQLPQAAATFPKPRKSPSALILLTCRPRAPRRCGRLLAAAGGGGGEAGSLASFGDVGDEAEALPSLESNPLQCESHDTETTKHDETGGSNSGGSRSGGLFRTPISGGVHTATAVHDLPPPALAVRNLMEQARFAHLCTVMSWMHHRRAGYPFGSLVDFAPDPMGHPIFSLSPLAIHTRNLLADPRCTLVVQIPGWSGLSNARVTIFGDVVPLPAEEQEWAHQQYVSKHQQWASHQWGNFYYYRMQTIR